MAVKDGIGIWKDEVFGRWKELVGSDAWLFLYTLYLLLKGRFLRIVAVTIALMLLYCPAGIVSLSHGNNSTISCTSQVLVN